MCKHSVPKYNAWAAAVGSITLTPLAGCGSYQTSTVASAGTHAGGGAIDIDLRNVAAGSRKWVADKGRVSGLSVAWHRNYRAGLWTWHCHAIDPSCPSLSRAAAGQVVEFRNGGDGLVGTTPDGNTRANAGQLGTMFVNRFNAAVNDVVAAVNHVAATHTPSTSTGFNYSNIKMDMSKGISASALKPGVQNNAHVARLQSAIWNWRGPEFRHNLVAKYKLTGRAPLYSGDYNDMTKFMVQDSYNLLMKLEPRGGWTSANQPGPGFLKRIGFKSVY